MLAGFYESQGGYYALYTVMFAEICKSHLGHYALYFVMFIEICKTKLRQTLHTALFPEFCKSQLRHYIVHYILSCSQSSVNVSWDIIHCILLFSQNSVKISWDIIHCILVCVQKLVLVVALYSRFCCVQRNPSEHYTLRTGKFTEFYNNPSGHCTSTLQTSVILTNRHSEILIHLESCCLYCVHSTDRN